MINKHIEILKNDFTIHRFKSNEIIPKGVFSSTFFWIGKTDNELSIKPQLKDFINEDVLGAVKSGMNVTFHFYTELHDTKNNILFEQENQIHVRNDIWENNYTITSFKFLKKITEFNKFKKFLLDSLKIKIDLPNSINEHKNLQLYLTFSPQKISKSQKEKIRN